MIRAAIFLLVGLPISTILLKEASRACDETLESRIFGIMQDLNALSTMQFAESVLSQSRAHVRKVPADQCESSFAQTTNSLCRGGALLVGTIESEPVYCQWLGAGPGIIELAYSENEETVQIFITRPQTLLNSIEW